MKRLNDNEYPTRQLCLSHDPKRFNGSIQEMNVTEYMDRLPLWAIFFASVAIILLSIEIGYRLGKRQRGRLVAKEKIQTGPVVAASLGLLAFILAFTFGSVTSRVADRQKLVLDEANVIGTVFLRADLLEPSDRDEFQHILYDYVNLRVKVIKGGWMQKVEEGIAKSEDMQDELWSRAVANAVRNPTPLSALFLQSLNEMIDLHQERVTVSIHHRMPGIFWIALYGLTVLAMIIGGYDAGLAGGRRSATTLLSVSLAFSMVLILVVSLDRPQIELAKVNQAALLDLQRTMQRSMRTQQ